MGFPQSHGHTVKLAQRFSSSTGLKQRQVQGLVKDDLLEMLALTEKQSPLKAVRDAALLLVGFAGAFRRSELVGLKCEDVTELPEGVELLLRKSKTDQEGHGRTVFNPRVRVARCPAKAHAHWLRVAGILEGWLFRPVNRHDKLVCDRPLTSQSVALILKAADRRSQEAEAAANVSGHSLRAGYVTTAAIQGLQPYQIREITGHRADAVLARYIRPISKRKTPPPL